MSIIPYWWKMEGGHWLTWRLVLMLTHKHPVSVIERAVLLHSKGVVWESRQGMKLKP